MLYNNGFPMTYQQPLQYVPVVQQPQQQPQQQGSGFICAWVQGEAGAKGYPVTPGTTVMLLDSENQTFYIKSADSSGMPMPLRVFDFTERTNQPVQEKQYITREEFEKKLAEINTNRRDNPNARKEKNNDGKPSA